MRTTIALSLFVLSSTLIAQKSVLLGASENMAATRLCSRDGVSKINGSWRPSPVILQEMESHLSDVLKLPGGSRMENPLVAYRQYLGIVVAGKHLIYINAISFEPSKDWKTRFEDICDGGSSVWGVLYDPASKTFFDLHLNGEA